jgi:hypothetical protein
MPAGRTSANMKLIRREQLQARSARVQHAFSKGVSLMACDGIYVRLNSGRDVCVPLYLAAQQRRADAETDPTDDDERAVRDLIGVAAVMRIASELFDGELRDGIRDAVRKGVVTRYAREQPEETRLGEAIAQARG